MNTRPNKLLLVTVATATVLGCVFFSGQAASADTSNRPHVVETSDCHRAVASANYRVRRNLVFRFHVVANWCLNVNTNSATHVVVQDTPNPVAVVTTYGSMRGFKYSGTSRPLVSHDNGGYRYIVKGYFQGWKYKRTVVLEVNVSSTGIATTSAKVIRTT